jgi:hypothetical protein
MSNLAATPTPKSLSRGRRLLLTLVLALLLWLPRGLALDRFVAVDERSWMTRSGNYYLALATGDLASTYQYYHPGVTTMWIGALAYLWQYPDYPHDATGQIRDMSEGIEDRLVAHGHAPMEILAVARSLMVVGIVLLLLVAFWLAVDLLGLLPALVGVLLIGFDPMTLGLTRMLHVDGLSSSLMLVSALALMCFFAPDPNHAGRWRDLILSGVMAGLAWLTKSPALVLGPLALLIMGIDLLRAGGEQDGILTRTSRAVPYRLGRGGRLWRGVRALALWGALAALVFVLCWPAMWVRPIANIQSILSAAGEYAEESNQQIFFNGEVIIDDPGALFYPITYLWHVTPVTLIGLALALVAGVKGARRRSYRWQNGAILLLYALLFAALMTFGSKKIDRYLLPAYFPLALVAGMGWCAVAAAVSNVFSQIRHSEESATRNPLLQGEGEGIPCFARNDNQNDTRNGTFRLGGWLLPVALAVQVALVLPHFPYYFTFYNPLLGGNGRAPEVLMIGLGEGIDQAARYLNTKSDAGSLRVASWYRGGSFNYIFRGQDLNLDDFFEADYAVLYVHQWQRQLPNAQMLHYFAQLTPEFTVTLHGLDYAWVYDLHNAPTPSYFTDWAGAIRLTQSEVPRTPLQPGERFLVNLYLHTIGTIDTNLIAIVRVVDAAGSEVAHHEAWPFGAATSTWQPGEEYIDGHELQLPGDLAAGYLRVEVGFYDGDSQALVTPLVAGTNTPRGEYVPVGYVGVGLAGKEPALLQSPPLLGREIKLLGARLQRVDLSDSTVPRVEMPPEEGMPVLPLTLAWQATQPVAVDYITLLHLVAPDGTLAKQFDRAPLQGVAPTSLWRTGDVLLDGYDLEIPADLPSGDYRLLAGLYDLPTLTRLPVQIDGKPAGDTIHIATVTVR